MLPVEQLESLMHCAKCAQEIYVSNHDIITADPTIGVCWHTVADDDPLCDGPDPSTDPEIRYFHRPQLKG